MSNSRTARLSGLDEVLNMLERMGKEGDKIAREAATRAATSLRQNYLVGLINGQTGIKRSVIMRYTYVKKATPKYEAARINFSSSGILVREYDYHLRKRSATRASIMIDWIGGSKQAAGFVNPSGKKSAALATRNDRTTKNRLSDREYRLPGQEGIRHGAKARKQLIGKTYSYSSGRLADARGPSIASIYKEIQAEAVEKASTYLSQELVELLDELLGDQ